MIEAALQENTQALRDLIAIIVRTNVVPVAEQKVKQEPAKMKQEVEKVKQEPVAVAVQPAPEVEKVEEQAVAALDYEKDIKPMLLKVVSVAGKDSLMAILKEQGVGKGTELVPEQFPAVLAAAKKALG